MATRREPAVIEHPKFSLGILRLRRKKKSIFNYTGRNCPLIFASGSSGKFQFIPPFQEILAASWPSRLIASLPKITKSLLRGMKDQNIEKVIRSGSPFTATLGVLACTFRSLLSTYFNNMASKALWRSRRSCRPTEAPPFAPPDHVLFNFSGEARSIGR
jgi:hypothetical protein